MQQAFYNEHDPYAAEWLRNLIMLGHIAPGVVDERDIRDLRPDELSGYSQCHFFAGIGIWSHALRLAGWRDDQPIWTGSCPCQPFSAAGGRGGEADERHLWPHWLHLIRECRPAIVLGEQVASKDGLGWLDLVSTDMEGEGYAFGASDLCAAGFGGAHIRQRLYFVGRDARLGDAQHARLEGHAGNGGGGGQSGWIGAHQARSASPSGGDGGVAHSRCPVLQSGKRSGDDAGAQGSPEGEARQLERSGSGHSDGSAAGGLAVAHRGERERIADGEGCQRDREAPGRIEGDGIAAAGDDVCGLDNASGSRFSGTFQGSEGDTRNEARMRLSSEGCGQGGAAAPLLGRNPADWLFCRDGKWRPVEPGTFPLAHEAASRVGRLRAYGNGLDAETATQFVGAVMETLDGER